MKIKINFEKNGKDVNKEVSLDFKSIAKHAVNSAKKLAEKAETFIENLEDTADEIDPNTENDASKAKEQVFENIDNLAKKAEERADQVIAKVDGFIKQVEDHLVKKVFEKDDSDKTDENDSVSGEGKSNSEKDIHFEETLGDGDDYPDEVDEKEAAKIALKNKISQIPEGETFTLAEYLDYTEEFNFDKTMSSYTLANGFLRAIKFPCTSINVNAFAKMLMLEKLSYKKLAREVSGYVNEGLIENLKEHFELWLNERPDVKKYCPNATLWQLLLYFRKKVIETEKN